MTTPVSYKPSEEGKTHINIFHRSRTELGQALYIGAKAPFRLEQEGFFNSLEGFYFWLLTGKKHNNLRMLYGASATSVGSKLPKVAITQSELESSMIAGLRAKIEQTPQLKRAVAKLRIPVVHYETFAHGDEVVRYKDPLPYITAEICKMTALGKSKVVNKDPCKRLADPGDNRRLLLVNYVVDGKLYAKFTFADVRFRNKPLYYPARANAP